MSDPAHHLFPPDAAADMARLPTGILPDAAIRRLVRAREIVAHPALEPDQIQPASLDLRLGSKAWRVRASFLPGPNATVLDKIAALDAHEIDLTHGAVLERNCVYVIPLQEALALKGATVGFANPKSSTGRLDILTRLITDRGTAFDQVERGYEGPLYAEIAPRTFSVVVRPGTRLNQLRFRRGSPVIASADLEDLYEAGQLVSVEEGRGALRAGHVGVSIDLRGPGGGALVGWRARKHTDRIDLARIAAYDPLDFWEPIHAHRSESIILDPDEFYILATREAVRIPPAFAAEMLAYDTSVGEFRVHYAGFFDPGFGCDPDGHGSRAVLEVRSHEVPFMLEHGQTIGWLRYERMAAPPDRLYGAGEIRSNYQNQGLKLAKQFKAV